MKHPWEQLPQETSRAFESFIAYRDMGLRRSCHALALQLNKNPSSIAELSKRHNWLERARAWDAFVDREIQKEQIEAVRIMKQRQIALALKAQEAAENGLKKFIAQFEPGKDGDLSPYAIRPDGLSKLLDTGCRLERLNRDEPEQSIEMTQNDKLNRLSVEELEIYRNLLAKVEGD